LEDRAGRPTKDDFPQPRMAIPSHYEQVGTNIVRVRQESVGDILNTDPQLACVVERGTDPFCLSVRSGTDLPLPLI
jgi:hypothetical protein